MEEKVLIKSERYNVKIWLLIIIIIIGTISLIEGLYWFCVDVSFYGQHYDDVGYVAEQHRLYDNCNGIDINASGSLCDYCYWYAKHPSKFGYALEMMDFSDYIFSVVGLSVTTILVLFFFWIRNYELTVTEKRVYGKTAFGKSVEFPVDSVLATWSNSQFKGVSILSSHGKFSFLTIKNANDICEVINKLLKEKQNKTDVI